MIEDIDMMLENTIEVPVEKLIHQSPKKSTLASAIPTSTSILSIARSPNLFRGNQNSLRQGTPELHHNLLKLIGQQKSIPQSIDYTLIYFFKYSLNFIYDTQLTMTVFQSFKLCNFHNNVTKFNLTNFLNYMANYMYVPMKKQGINNTIEIHSKIKDEIIANYEYLRLIVFNFLNFIFNNTQADSQMSRKDVKIYVEYENISEADGIFKFFFEFNEENPVISYDKLSTLLEANHKLDITPDHIEKFYKYMDVGIFVSYFIIKKIYNKELKIDTINDRVRICFEINGKHLENKNLYEVLKTLI
jgi:hypothetical protein